MTESETYHNSILQRILAMPTVGVPDPTITDRDAFVAAISGGHGRLGAAIGGVGQQPALFTADMLAFHRSWSARI